jgi:hypothetical protein
MKKLFLLIFAAASFMYAEISDADFKTAAASPLCKKILDRGDFINNINNFVFYLGDNQTKHFLSAYNDVLLHDKLPAGINESVYIEQGLEFELTETKMNFGIKEDETHFVTMFLMDNTPYMCYFSDNKRYIFQYDKKTESFKEACVIKRISEYEYK